MFKVPTFHRYPELNKILLTLNKFLIQGDQYQNNQKNKATVFLELGSKAFQIPFSIRELKMEKAVIQPMIQLKLILILILESNKAIPPSMHQNSLQNCYHPSLSTD